MLRVRWFISVSAMVLAVSILAGCAGGEAQSAGNQPVSNRTVVVEVFTSADCPQCPPAKEALENLASDYELDKVLLLEYALTGHLACDDGQARAGEYKVRSVPTVVFNGQNKTEEAKSYDEYKEIVESELFKDTTVTLIAMRSISSDVVSINAAVTNSGVFIIENAWVMCVVYEDIGEPGNHCLVRDIIASSLNNLSAGESRDFSVMSETLFWCDMSNMGVVVFVLRTDSKEILQATLAKM